jgi:8-oxo-dGTP diphosphatase
MVFKRRKGVAIVDTSKGILVVSGRKKIFALPGGGANKGESREKATIRELCEETGLKTQKAKYFFSYKGHKWKTHKGRTIINYVKVFLIKTKGIAKPKHEIKHIAYYNSTSKIKISDRTEKIIKSYLEMKQNGKLF